MPLRLPPRSILAFVLFAIGCGGTSEDDAGLDSGSRDAGSIACTESGECSDGVVCNGEERCVFGEDPDVGVCAAGTPPCGEDTCDEATGECSSGCADADGDGAADRACGGSDCDDADPLRFPGAVEVCDVDNRDEDCDERTFGVRDADGDDSPDANCCNGDNCGDDCDDTRAAVNPGMPEDCNGGDEDCDGEIDEDCDCVVPDSRDCPGAMGLCAAGSQTCVDGTWGDCSVTPTPEICNGTDNDCDGTIDNGVSVECFEDPDGDGFAASTAASAMRCACQLGETSRVPASASTTDCREAADASVPDALAEITHPGATEICDGFDNDCSSGGGDEIREDRDGDEHTLMGYGGCTGGPYPRDDCGDFNGNIFPGAGYQTVGYCAGSLQQICNCGGSSRCVSIMIPCAACSSGSGSPPLFDYNCDGVTQPRPPRSGGCGPGGGATPCVGAGCGPTTPQSSSNCGTSVQHSCCGGVTSCMTTTSNRLLGCR